MTQPGYSTDTASLRAASQKWASVSAVIGSAAGSAQSLVLSDGQFSALGSALGLGREYAKIQQLLARVLKEGARHTNYVAVALKSSARDYEGNDQKSVGMYNSMGKD